MVPQLVSRIKTPENDIKDWSTCKAAFSCEYATGFEITRDKKMRQDCLMSQPL